MRRRKFILGTGVFAAGSAGAIQTGAFTSVSADRGVSVAVAGDDSALLAIDGCDGPNGKYVTGAGSGTATLNISDTNGNIDGSGVNPDAVSVIHNALQLTNQGTQPVSVWLNVEPIDDRVEFYLGSDQSTEIVGEDNAKCLGVGDSICIGLKIDTTGLESDADLFNAVSDGHEMVVNADAGVDCAAPPLDGDEKRSLSTGVADWEVTALPPGASPPTGKSIPYDAFTVDPPEAWATSGTNAQWVDPFGTGGLQNDPADDDDPYEYEVTFYTDEERDLVIQEYGSDNPVEFSLDGTPIGGSNGQNAFTALRSNIQPRTIAPGQHTLTATVYNNTGSSGNPTGLLVAARLD